MYKLLEHSSKVLRVNWTNKSSRLQCYGIMAVILSHYSPITACATASPLVIVCNNSKSMREKWGKALKSITYITIKFPQIFFTVIIIRIHHKNKKEIKMESLFFGMLCNQANMYSCSIIIIKLIKPTPQVSKLCKLTGIKLKGL